MTPLKPIYSARHALLNPARDRFGCLASRKSLRAHLIIRL
jgi:hypothetical protein